MSNAVLPWPFEVLRQRLETGAEPYATHVLAAYAASLTNETEFDLSRLESLESEADQSLFRAIFGYCLEHGLTEDERALIASTFTDASHAPGGAS
jgi:hypothetical protein